MSKGKIVQEKIMLGLQVKHFVHVCYDRTGGFQNTQDKLLYYLGKKKRRITREIIDEYQLPIGWLGKTPAFTVPVRDKRKRKIVNVNHMCEDLIFVSLEAGIPTGDGVILGRSWEESF